MMISPVLPPSTLREIALHHHAVALSAHRPRHALAFRLERRPTEQLLPSEPERGGDRRLVRPHNVVAGRLTQSRSCANAIQLRCTVQVAPAARSSAHNFSAPARLSLPTCTRAQPMLPRASPWCKTRGSRPPRMDAYFP